MEQNMIVYSWNMLFRNRELDCAFSFITEGDFDIFCLQEVPQVFLERLKTLPYAIAYRTDAERTFTGDVSQYFNVILSKFPITHQSDLAFPDYWPTTPLRSRLFIRLMKLFHFSKVSNRGGLYADVDANGTTVRVFNLHLILAHPTIRLKELEFAMTQHKHGKSTIVCGDFNIIESPHMSILNWLMGGNIGDAVFYTRERTTIERRFVEHQLTNPLRGTVTHPLSRSQLDHILVSHQLTVENAQVITDRYGSDHNPIRVQLTKDAVSDT